MAYNSQSKKWGHVKDLFALIIGIDKYNNATNLFGAVSDANHVDSFLRNSLKVSDHRIVNLRDEQATRKEIEGAFCALWENDSIKRDDPILVYFGGHGCEIPKPEEWEPDGQEKIQGIYPQDVEPKESENRSIFPIPDRTLAFWLDKLSTEKGNNIIVIFDCCHASSGTRGDGIRTDKFYGDIPPDIDNLMKKARGQEIPAGFRDKRARSHVLLAACGAAEEACEVDGRGLFTTAFLETMAGPGVDTLSYVELMKQLPDLERKVQNPQCEGHHKGRMLFSNHIPEIGFHLFPVVQDTHDTYKIEAGSAHSVTVDSLFHVYNEAAIESVVNKRICTLRVREVHAFYSFATLEPHGAALGDPLSEPAHARHVRSGPGKALQVHFSIKLLTVVPFCDVTKNNVVATDKERADFVVNLQGKRAVFDITREAVTKYGYERLPYDVPADAESVSRVLLAAAQWKLHFDNHLHSQWGGKVHLDFIQLEQDGKKVDETGYYVMRPKNAENLNVNNVVDLVVRLNDYYGIKIRNETNINLYPSLFFFDVSDQSITSYYKGPVGGGSAIPDAPLPGKSGPDMTAGSPLTIGYGSGGGLPFSYQLPPRMDIDIGFLKLYLTTKPIDLEWFEQKSAFDKSRGPVPMREIQKSMVADSWGTISCTIVQRRARPSL